jgi:hypothetical protein
MFAKVRLDRNLTLKRLPEECRTGTIRLVVWEHDLLSEAKCVADIYENIPKKIIKEFNGNREDYILCGNISCEVQAMPEKCVHTKF